MGLSNLIEEAAWAEKELSEPVSIRIDTVTLSKAQHLADELGIVRTSVLRDAIEIGMGNLMAEWERALEQGARVEQEKKNASAKR